MNQNSKSPAFVARDSGFTLPTILIVVAALLILAVGILLIVKVERHTTRYSVDRKRAYLAVDSGLECFKGILTREATNDDYLIIQGTAEDKPNPNSAKELTPYLYLVRGKGGGDRVTYRYLPLFSIDPSIIPAEILPPEKGHSLDPPKTLLGTPLAVPLLGDNPAVMNVIPWFDPAEVAWNQIQDDQGRVVSRYAFWVEDLQGKLNPKVVGNVRGKAGSHQRAAFPDHPSQPCDAQKSSADVLAVHVLDPVSGDAPHGEITQRIITARPAMISPNSVLGAAAFDAQQPRSPETGLLVDPLAAALERSVCPVIQDYREQPIIPYSLGISEKSVGKPKLNLNKLLKGSRKSAVEQFSKHIEKALPNFDKRRGGFPEDYLKTLAANAFDYADKDNLPTVLTGSYRGIDNYPLLNELALKVEYLGHRAQADRLLLQWRVKLFGEIWNFTNQKVQGKIRLSYEVGLNHSSIAGGPVGIPFDQKQLLEEATTPQLSQINGRFYSDEIEVTLKPDEYQFHKFVDVTSEIDVGPNKISYNTKFHLEEPATEARGVSVLWNGIETERIHQIIRDPVDPLHSDPADPKHFSMRFNILSYPWTTAKAVQLSACYGYPDNLTRTMGDVRMSHYFRDKPCSDGRVKDMSPNNRNLSRPTFYDEDSPDKSILGGRVLPSEWPDGGHNSTIANFPIPPNSWLEVEPSSTDNVPAKIATGVAPSRISNAGRFYSPTELGNLYDPVMWSSTYPDLKGSGGSGARDTQILLGDHATAARMPAARHAWPEVALAAVPDLQSGGGNTLRIGRPEHERFDVLGKHAAYLLDLFHAGDREDSAGLGAEATTVNISGHININTADKDTLRAMAAGMLNQDPELRKVTDWKHHLADERYSPATKPIKLGTPTFERAADKVADAIILSRPFSSFKELACAKNATGESVFGNKMMYEEGANLQWTDAAAEEVFSRVHDAATLRSRNFRIWVVGQAVTEASGHLEILAESRKAFCVFADPGPRDADGTLVPEKSKIRVTFQTDF